ncbi:heme-degrading domain-containing protein [Saccharothrix violaceirubra]|uniref:Uncharacterized protein (UPF0303 family) n=1 Tax=Saccharothrix violaceirubra TaxID=413306 RepID=A0A7W7SYK9_9PSEU|nr:heme-degrading domain-containing protein [Saccharothrix violaceirubra]MBB4963337.1 uncharacterized protein (UPF0303 family) [Saccharothrix violaceirubra]
MLEELEAQEARLVFRRFDNDTAIALGTALLTAARDRGLPIVVSVRRGQQRLFHAALPGTSADNDDWIDRKSRVVDRYGRSSLRVRETFAARGREFPLDPALYAAFGGVFPIIVENVGPVGTVGVSGLPHTEDHAFVVERLEAFLERGGR